MARPTSTEIAERIKAHLKAAEADEGWNWYERETRDGSLERTSRFYNARCWRGGRWILVVYVSYQGRTPLTREEAERYLAWLDAGNRGRHFEAFREGA